MSSGPPTLDSVHAISVAIHAPVLGSLTDWHGWKWEGWPALVAIGTLLLALATGVLAWFTYQVTKESRDEIVLEQRRLEAAQRPIMLPAALEPRPKAIGDPQRALIFMNAGPGAALNVVCRLRWSPPSGHTVWLPKLHVRPGGSAELPVGGAGGSDWLLVKGAIVCDDLAGDAWQTDFVIRSVDESQPATLDVQPPRRIDAQARASFPGPPAVHVAD
jgi:hypothetical protein